MRTNRPKKVSQLPARTNRRKPREVLTDLATELRERNVMTWALAKLALERFRDAMLDAGVEGRIVDEMFEALLLALCEAAARGRDLARALHEAADAGRFHPGE